MKFAQTRTQELVFGRCDSLERGRIQADLLTIWTNINIDGAVSLGNQGLPAFRTPHPVQYFKKALLGRCRFLFFSRRLLKFGTAFVLVLSRVMALGFDFGSIHSLHSLSTILPGSKWCFLTLKVFFFALLWHRNQT